MTPARRPRTGVHTSVRRGFAAAAEMAGQLGCDTLQFFTHSPSDWRTRVPTDDEYRDFRTARERLGLHPAIVHTPYLPNLCTSDEKLFQRSIRALKEDLMSAERLGAEYLVIHPGSYSPGSNVETGIERIAAAFREVFADMPGKTRVLIENMAGGGRRLGGPFREIGEMLRLAGNEDRLGVCFDTCHAFAAGYDLSTENGAQATVDEFDREIGLDRLFVFHVNDSAGALSCHRDLHQHLGEGHIGLDGFRALFRDGRFSHCPMILETPKIPFPESDLDNLRKLRGLL